MQLCRKISAKLEINLLLIRSLTFAHILQGVYKNSLSLNIFLKKYNMHDLKLENCLVLYEKAVLIYIKKYC